MAFLTEIQKKIILKIHMELEKDPKYPKKSQEEWKMLNTLKLLTSNHIAKLRYQKNIVLA